MLVLTRKLAQVITLGENITITVVRMSHGAVTLGIEAPSDIRIRRTELCGSTGSPTPESKAA